jgi:hypothetical protein
MPRGSRIAAEANESALARQKRRKFLILFSLSVLCTVLSLAPFFDVATDANLLFAYSIIIRTARRTGVYLRSWDLVERQFSALRKIALEASSTGLEKMSRLDRETFEYVLNYFQGIYDHHPLRLDEQGNFQAGRGRPRTRAIDARVALLIQLRLLAGDPNGDDVSLMSSLVPGTRSRTMKYARKCLLRALKQIPECSVKFPATDEEAQGIADLARGYIGNRFMDSIGVKDGKVFRMEEPTANQFLWLDGKTSRHGHRAVIIWLWDGTIALAGIHFAAGRNDGYVDLSLQLQEHMEHLDPKFYIISDSGFEGNSRVLRAVTSNDYNRLTPEEQDEYNSVIGKVFRRLRSSTEWGNGGLEKAFRVLQSPAPADDWEGTAETVECCLYLHNLRVRRMGVGQLHTVLRNANLVAEMRRL